MTQSAIARLTKHEVESLRGLHPNLAAEPGPVLAFSAADDRQAELMSTLIATWVQYTAETAESGEKLIEAMLPTRRLDVSGAALRQVERNAHARVELADEFGLLTSAQIAHARGSKATNLSQQAYRWRLSGRIFAVGVGPDSRFPGFQFDEHGEPRPIVADVIREFAGLLDGWDLALWFGGANGWLGGVRPVDVLERGNEGELADLLRAARELAADIAEARQLDSVPE